VWCCLARILYIYLHINSIISGTPRASLVQSYMNIVCHIYKIYIIHSHQRGVSAASNSHYCMLTYYTFIHPLPIYIFIAIFLSLPASGSLCMTLWKLQNTILQLTKYYEYIIIRIYYKNELFMIIKIHFCYCLSVVSRRSNIYTWLR